jgi:eukaryotic-like serine/threonine-protein kinase
VRFNPFQRLSGKTSNQRARADNPHTDDTEFASTVAQSSLSGYGPGDGADYAISAPVPLAPAARREPSYPSVPSNLEETPYPRGALPDVLTDLGADSMPSPLDAALEAQPTVQQIGRYAIKGPNALGQGGLGQVHEAWDPLLSRTIALKTLHFDVDSSERGSLDGQFLNEARAAAGLSHPHIVTVYDAGVSARGVYIAMERLHGQDLRKALAEGWRPKPTEAAVLVRRVADALAYAHGRGVVHCDIKPANIFLDEDQRPKVLDFGIARVAHRSAPLESSGLLIGTPHYLAPEQLSNGTVDARTDIHALGTVFYELLTLRKAFGGDSVEQITSAVLTSHPAPAHHVNAKVSPTLSAIAAKAMARQPDARYASASDMANDLRRWSERQVSSPHNDASAKPAARPPVIGALSTFGDASADPALSKREALRETRRAAKASKRQVSATAQALRAAALLLLVAGGLSWMWSSRQADEPPSQVVVNTAEQAAPAAAPMAAPTSAEAPAPPASTAAPVLAAAETASAPVPTAEPVETVLPPLNAKAPATPAVAPSTAPTPTSTVAKPETKPKADPKATPRAEAVRAAAPVGAATGTGTLQLAISPWGHVDIDGTRAGTTPPLTRLPLPVGLHTVTIRNEDFPPYTVQVQVLADKAVTVRHSFAQ